MGLYKAGFERAGQLFGADLATGFIGFIAISRSGWRETDLRALLPKLSSAPWDELRFAYLRRLFRGQLRQRGSTGRWDFAHTQMRISALSYLASLAVSETAVHSLAGEHLLELPREDPLRQTETMVHLIHGLLQMHDLLAVPVKNSDGEVWNAQFISPDGKKRYFKHSRKKGLAFRIGPPASSRASCWWKATQLALLFSRPRSSNGAPLAACGRQNWVTRAASRSLHPDFGSINKTDTKL